MFRQHPVQLYLDKWLQHLCHGDSRAAPHYLHCCTQSHCVQFLDRRCLQELAHFPHQSKLQLPYKKTGRYVVHLYKEAQSSQDSCKGGSWHSVCTMGGGCALKSTCIWTYTSCPVVCTKPLPLLSQIHCHTQFPRIPPHRSPLYPHSPSLHQQDEDLQSCTQAGRWCFLDR